MLSLVHFFQNFLQRNITVTIVLIAVLIVRVWLKRFSKKFSYLLWSFVGIRMLFDISITSGLSLFTILHTARDRFASLLPEKVPGDTLRKVWEAEQKVSGQVLPAGEAFAENGIFAGTDSQALSGAASTVMKPELASGHAGEIVWVIFAVLWIVGMLAILCYGIFAYGKCKQMVKQAVRLKGNVWECDRISSPFVLGIFFPQIYIPFHVEEQERIYILAHERFHIRRRDYLVKPFAFLLLAVYWINPMVWLAFPLMSRDMEMSCDEAVLEKYGDKIKKIYSMSLLRFAEGRRVYSFAPIALGEADAKRRIKNILRFKKPQVWVTVLLLLTVGILGIICLTNDKAKASSEEDIPPELYAVYMEAVQRLADENVFPNGQQAYPDGSLYADNGYLIMDVDKDGRAELLIDYPMADSMAAMCFYIFDYDDEKGEFYEELAEFPAVKIYDNGIIIAEASHNHGRSSLDNFWPYSVYQYERESDTYKRIAVVDAWQYIRYEGAEADEEFPKEQDADGDGIVYYMQDQGYYTPTGIMDNAAYEKWSGDLIAKADLLQITFNKLPVSDEIPESSGMPQSDGIPESNGMPQSNDAGLYEQFRIIAQNKDMWIGEPDYADEVYKYAVTDLDRNGRLEIIVSNMGGTGIYTYSSFYEVNENYDGLYECETNFIEGHSQPDIIASSWATYMDMTGKFYYVVYDGIRMGAAEYHESIWSLSLENGQITVEPIASKVVVYTEEEPKVTYEDAAGNEISVEEVIAAATDYFAGCDEDETYLEWQDVRNLKEDSREMVEQIAAAYHYME